MSDTLLAPIETTPGLVMKLVFYFMTRQFGKVPTPLRVHSARLPLAFGMFYGKVSKLDEKLQLPPELVMLIRQRVAQVNVCLFCMDIGRWFTIQKSMNQTKFDALDQYATIPLFTEAERAVLDYVTQLTKEKKVDPDNLCPHGAPLFRACDLRDKAKAFVLHTRELLGFNKAADDIESTLLLRERLKQLIL